MEELRQALTEFARSLASERWYSSPSYETTTRDEINEAVAHCKADIGERLLEALGVQKENNAR